MPRAQHAAEAARSRSDLPPELAAVRAREDRAIMRALRIVERRAGERGALVNDNATARHLFLLRLAGEPREHFEVAFLDNKHRMIAVERLFSGTVDGSAVYPRVVVQRALALNAAAIIIAHNHPSGDTTPSAADKALTHRLRDALELVEVRLLDHVIVGTAEACSMSKGGTL